MPSPAMTSRSARTQSQNVKAVIADILGHGNDKAMLPGQMEAEAAALTDKPGGLLFSAAEIQAFDEVARAAGVSFDPKAFKSVEV